MPRMCVFCDETRVTREHLLPSWLNDVLSKGRHAQGTHRRGPGIDIPITREHSQSVGLNLVAKIVCKNCNEGWMSDVEDDAKPILVSLFKYPSLKRAFSVSQQIKIANWAYLH